MPSPKAADSRKGRPKAKATSLSNSTSSPGLYSNGPSGTDIDWTVFGLDLEPPPGRQAAGVTNGGRKSDLQPPSGSAANAAASLRSPQPTSEAARKWRVKLESLDESQVRATAVGEPSLSHLQCAHKRKPGYLERLPSLSVLLDERGVDYSRPNPDRDVQLPLEAFEDTTMCTRLPQEWHQLMFDSRTGAQTPLTCNCLRLQGDGSGRWEIAVAQGWDPESQRFVIKWASGSEDKVLNLHVLFEGDDPVLFADRLAKALKHRRWAHSLLKYNFFIDSMPEDLNRKIGRESTQRIAHMAKAGIWDVQSEFADKLERKLEGLCEEAQKDYRRVQNHITFEKVQTHVVSGQAGLGSVLGDLQLPPPPPPKEVPYLAVKVLPTWDPSMGPPDPALPRDFRQAFEWFCKASLLIRPEVCGALQVTRSMCLDLLTERVFETQFLQPMRLQEFVERQEAATTRLRGRLGMWVNTIRMQITTRLQQATQKWYHLNETNIDSYRASRLRPLLVAARLMMSNAILILAEDNLATYSQAVEGLVPLRLHMEEDSTALKRVINIVADPKAESGERELEPLFKQTLFKMEVVIRDIPDEPEKPPETEGKDKKEDKKKDKKEEKKDEPPPKPKPLFAYTTPPGDFQKAIQAAFERGVSAFQDVHSVESVLLPHLIRDERLDPNFTSSDPWVTDLKKRIDAACQIQEPWLEKVLEHVDAYRDVVQLDPSAMVKKMKEGDPLPPQEVRKMIEDRLQRQKEVQKGLPDDREPVPVGFYRIDLSSIRSRLSEKLEVASQVLLQCLAEQLDTDIGTATAQFSDIFKRLKEDVSNIEELTDMRDFIKSIPGELSKLQGGINDAMQLTEMVEDLRFVLPAETLDSRWRMFGSPGDVKREVRRVEEYLDGKHKEFKGKQENDQQAFEKRLNDLEQTIESFAAYDDLSQVSEVADKTAHVNDEIKKCQELVRLFNSREVLFDRDQTDYSALGGMIKVFEPYSNLWKTAGDWVKNKQSWLNGNFEEIDPRYCENEVTGGIRLLFKTIRSLKEDEDKKSIVGIAEQIKSELEEFKPNLPLVVGLRNEGVRDRHWEQISTKCGVEIGPYMEGGLTLQRMLDVGLLNFSQDVADVGDRAGKEFQLEKALRKMKGDWEETRFDLSEKYRKTNTYILKGEGEAMVLLDEHIVTTQAMMFSLFKGPFEEEIDEWNSRLMRVSETLDEWLKCQRSWMYLQPIFDSDDIMKQLPTEGKRFKHVDATWRQEMNNARDNPKIIEACNVDGLLEKWRECNTYLDMVQKGLEDYLETKRNAFARFYFLSNDELLEILSQSKDPTRVQPFLSKVFEAIGKITFTAELDITEMRSPEGEVVAFVTPVVTHGQNVEVWMSEVENGMKAAIRNVVEIGVQTYPETERTVWVLENPAQVVLNSSQVHWTAEVEAAFAENQVEKYRDQLSQQIQDLVMLLRKGLSKAQRTAIGALIVIDVHARDVVTTYVEQNINDIASFEWISQLRYYWTIDDKGLKNMDVRCVQTGFPYGYEYLGNSMRLVITPLTDMCYITLMGAQALSLGGAPAGPAGTGKTETTKDLAKALAKQCVVFNCSPEMDYIMVGKFFKGLAFSGAWCCFDEFNRINIEVLSVIAQQLLVLFGKKGELVSYSDTAELEFEGTLIVMKPTFNVFITMNPGYAGRAELPDNLAALFRPVAMMVPDYALIGEIMFYAYGFTDSRMLAKKMVTTFKLSSEQLSSQCHYDYGMRAVKSTIEAGGKLKRELGGTWAEDQITLRALRDVNVPKFLKDDLPLFENIISDLFPTTKRPEVEYGDLLTVMQDSAKEINLQLPEIFIVKVVQLIDTINVRHGLMLVGPTGGGKTANYRLLQHTSIALKEQGDAKYEKVQTHILNPKSITQAQLYGAFDEVTREWQDGIASEQVRVAVASGKGGCPDNHWVIFDGPVDALWIESMNTVLDDNKKLCLTSGEIIALTPQMRMIFEVEDLTVASPATVSRCGMVYMEPSALGLTPLIDSWCNTLPSTFKKEYPEQLKQLTVDFDTPMIWVARKKVKEISATVDNNLLQSHFRLLDCFFFKYIPTEAKTPSADEIANFGRHIQPLFFFTLIWTVGATCDNKGRPKTSEKLWKLLQEKGMNSGGSPPLQENDLWYDYVYNADGENEGRWMKWLEWAPPYSVPRAAEYQNIVVPTLDSIRLTYTFATLIQRQKHVIVAGNTGTGKSVYIKLWLQREAGDSVLPLFVNFSAQTGVNQVQDLLDSKFEKRRRGVYGPPAGKYNVIFVDDLNMPRKEYYGAQPPIELIRQWMDYGGWFNRKELKMQSIIDIIHVSAMGPPGGGRTEITGRLRRHYNTITAADLARESIVKIFATILGHFMNPFEAEIQGLVPTIVESSIVIFERAMEDLLPTPAKAHYTFNLRDIWKVFQGICSINAKKVNETVVVMRCWSHENLRVYGDRLINNADRDWFRGVIEQLLTEQFKKTPSEVLDKERLIFADFMGSGDAKYYLEVADLPKLKETMENYLEDYNNMFTVAMPLVMFFDACEHVTRICRVLRQPAGNALLLGVGGSGRQSLSRLASFIVEFDCFQIEVVKGYGMTEFKEDLKVCLMKCGNELKTQTFLFADTQIVNEQMVEAMNNVLNSGDVPNLYKQEDLDCITMACRAACQSAGMQPTKANVFTQYITRVKACVHVVLAFSPVGDAFRSRLRMFPSLVDCCTIDWFAEWPAEALYSVGKQQMTLEDLKLPNLEGVLKSYRVIHQSVEQASAKILEAAKRAIYVTPTSFLELITTFKKVLSIRRGEVGTLRNRLQKGLDALGQAAWAVANMEKELTAKQPVLEQTKKDVAALMVVITEDKAKAAVTKSECEVVEQEAKTQAESATAIKEDAQRDLDEALPALDVATKALKALKLSNIQEVKALGNPPAGVKLAMEAVCVMFAVKPVKKADPANPGKKFDDYWEASQKGPLMDPKKLLDDLFEFDKDNIPEPVITKIQPYIDREDFDPAAIKKSSVACEALCMWCRAMHKYHFVAKAVEPKRQMLAAAEADLEKTMSKLRGAQAELKAVEDKIAKLEAGYNDAVKKQDTLSHEMEMCTLKLGNASKLIDGLGGEKERWQVTVASLSEKYELLPGDSLIAAGMVAYAGPFTSEYRTEFESLWRETEDKENITKSEGANLVNVLGQPVLIQQWVVCSLPNDNLSVENGIILNTARRWALMIDPQRQANKFIKLYGKAVSEAGLYICKLSDPNFLQTLELGIQFGRWVILENIGEQLDPALEPVLQQQKIRDGSSFVIKLGDKTVNYDDKFRFFMTTTFANPHYSPEVSVKVSLLNFAITPEGLQDQMLGIVVQKEQPEMEEKKQELVKNNAAMNKQLKEIEDKILELLSADGDILESKELIDTLEFSKKTSAVINKAMEEGKITEVEIDKVRKSYRDYAFRSQLLFFCVSELAVIDPMYQFSLQWFQQLAALGIDNAPSGESQDVRLQNLIDYFTYSIYQSVCRGLFEKHKLLLSFSLCMKIMNGEGRLNQEESRFLLTGPTGDIKDGPPNPAPEWLSDKSWNEVLTLSRMPNFKNLELSFAQCPNDFKKIYDNAEADKEPLPGEWELRLAGIQRLCFLRTLRPDRLTTAVLFFVQSEMGQKFVEPPTFDIAISYEDSTKMSPLIFVLSPGSDPVADMLAFAEIMNMTNKLESISLGQGQGPKAARLIENARVNGGWVLLCNCHLSVSWLPELERICEQTNPDETDNNYRLWLTSMPTAAFPTLLLQSGIKMTNEPPKGLRANVLGSMAKADDKILNDCVKPEPYMRLFFAFCFFHAICQDRRKFGPIGWNVPYNFTMEDLVTNRRQLKYFLDNYEEIPYKVLVFLGAKINYGGRVTDKMDKRLIECMIKVFICEPLVTKGPGYKFSPSGTYFCPKASTQEEFLTYLRTLPITPSPEIFGLHENCELTCAESEAMNLLEDIMSMAPRSGGGGGKSADTVMDDMAKELIDQTPKLFDLDALEDAYPTRYDESRNTVLKQESLKYNRLIQVLMASLPLFRRALKGMVAMTEDLEAVGTGLFMNLVPEKWAASSFLSLKPLTAWMKDLNMRVDFMNRWVDYDCPVNFWLSGLFFPQAFFTATLQNYARKHQIAIDRLSFDFDVHDEWEMDGSNLKEHPESGSYLWGLFLEGCRWDFNQHILGPSLPKKLFVEVPVVHFIPEADRKAKPGVYCCPVYRVLSRKGTLATTGHSTNFVVDLDLPSKDDPDDWIRAGVACFLSLKY